MSKSNDVDFGPPEALPTREGIMGSAARKTIIPLWLIIGLGLSACATQEQIRAELESEGGRTLIKEAVQAEMQTMMKSEGMKEMMMKMMKEMDK